MDVRSGPARLIDDSIEGASPSHFKFKARKPAYTPPPANVAQRQSGKAPAMGLGQLGGDGRPALNCAQTPMDPACR
ncbi:hypothetical protein [Frateuria defendens]|uniref:hypothetical protein n=1 Tax=Frateuria defendens TaxID=2219559 RepID=UPI00066FF1C1|nr:hypothetical protein [Frateuria defendens]